MMKISLFSQHKIQLQPAMNIVDSHISKILANNPSFKYAFFDTCSLNETQIKNLAQAISKNTFLEKINLAGCNFNESDLLALLRAFELNSSIKTIVLDEYKKATITYHTYTKAILSKVHQNALDTLKTKECVRPNVNT